MLQALHCCHVASSIAVKSDDILTAIIFVSFRKFLGCLFLGILKFNSDMSWSVSSFINCAGYFTDLLL